ncbi:MAG: trypsin-like peptidase domain-containing protein [Desulfobacterales bacterium]|nr:trypsin-like peptidase domain-containing protein [Desulfobacterales bacterium]
MKQVRAIAIKGSHPATALLTAMLLSIALLVAALPARAEAVKMIPANFSELAEKASLSVVNIRTEKRVSGGGRVSRHFQQSPFGDDDRMNEFFNRFFGDQRQREFKQRSLGSGFIMDPKGYIVTNNHVVEDTDAIKVILKDGKEYDASIVGRDASTDLALIKIDADESLPALSMGDSETLKVGQWVVAIGNPFGLGHTVTAGIVSAKGRVIGSGPYDDFIQTDTSINPGNSGGPLLNLAGEVVGINTAIIQGGQGLGFAIPAKLAKGIVAQLKEDGNVTRGWLGVSIQEIEGSVAEYYGLEGSKGVLVLKVFENDPAAKAGMKANDVIVSIDGESVATVRDLTGIVAAKKVGDKVKVVILRKGKKKTLKVKVGKRMDRQVTKAGGSGSGDSDLGIDIAAMTPEMAKRYGLGDSKGVLITGVDPRSKGGEAGLAHGDIIKEINHHAIKDEESYFEALDGVKKGEPVNMLVIRRGQGYVLVRFEK